MLHSDAQPTHLLASRHLSYYIRQMSAKHLGLSSAPARNPALQRRDSKASAEHLSSQSTPLRGLAEASWNTAVKLLGLRLSHPLRSPLDIHDKIQGGLPAVALTNLLGNLVALSKTDSLGVLGISMRTLQRLNEVPKPLDAQQSARVWNFAEVLGRATRVFGSQEDAEQWLQQPAIGLDQRRPIDLLKTPTGSKTVETFLERLEHGVYT
jgi:putative toxin-antitoxin system antitoxin component (TIGR02293 family)